MEGIPDTTKRRRLLRHAAETVMAFELGRKAQVQRWHSGDREPHHLAGERRAPRERMCVERLGKHQRGLGSPSSCRGAAEGGACHRPKTAPGTRKATHSKNTSHNFDIQSSIAPASSCAAVDPHPRLVGQQAQQGNPFLPAIHLQRAQEPALPPQARKYAGVIGVHITNHMSKHTNLEALPRGQLFMMQEVNPPNGATEHAMWATRRRATLRRHWARDAGEHVGLHRPE